MQRGTALGPYRLGDVLGAGGQAEVFSAVDERSGVRVVVKVLQEDLPAEYHARFLRECEILKGLSHPNVVGVLASGKESNRPYYVMPFVEADPLDRILAGTYRPGVPGQPAPAASEWFLDVVMQLLDGLSYSHGQGVCHRDLKPANVLVDRKGTAFLLDFGLALLEDATAITAEGQMMGTISYMSPEHVQGVRPDARSDVYQMGLLLHEVFTGYLPFPELSSYQALMRRMRELPPDPVLLNPHLPPALGAAILHACQPDPALRTASCDALRAELAGVAPRGFLLPPHPEQEPTEVPPPEAEEPPASPATWAAVAVLVLLVAGGVWYWVVPREPDHAATARELRRSGEAGRAEVHYRLALDREGAPEALRDEVALFLVEQGRPEEALEALGERRAALVRPAAARVAVAVAESRRARGQADDARALADEVALAQPAGAEPGAGARFLLAALDLGANQAEAALARLEGVTAPALRVAAFKARALRTLGRPAEALAALEPLVPSPPASLTTSPASPTTAPASTEPPDVVLVLDEVSASLEALGRTSEALVPMHRAVGALPTAERWFRVGRLQDRLGLAEPSLAAYGRAVTLDARHQEAALALFVGAVGLSRVAERALAVVLLRRQSHPRMAAVQRFLQLQQAMEAGNADPAALAQALDEVDKAVPGFLPVEWLRCEAQVTTDPRKALIRLRELESRQPAFAAIYASQADAARGMGLIDEAVGYMRRGVEVAPRMAAMCLFLAELLWEAGRTSEAVLALQAFLVGCPGEYLVRLRLGGYLQRLGEMPRAVGQYLSVCRALPVDRTPGFPAPAGLEVQQILAAVAAVEGQQLARAQAEAAAQLKPLGVPVPRPARPAPTAPAPAPAPSTSPVPPAAPTSAPASAPATAPSTSPVPPATVTSAPASVPPTAPSTSGR